MNKETTVLTKRDNYTIGLLQWIRRYPGWWYLICTPDDEHMDFETMRKIVEQLAKEQFYEIIFVALTVHRKTNFMDITFKTMLIEMILAGWQDEVYNKERMMEALMQCWI